jgi:DNA-binding transcriptional LysR family regulator
MAKSEWLRTFVAVYRTHSMTEAADIRGISQPAASQQIAKLEATVGTRLFERRHGGLRPTPEARGLYGQVAGPLDQLENAIFGLEAGMLPTDRPSVRIGCSTTYQAEILLGQLDEHAPRMTVRFGSDIELTALLHAGEIDIAMTNASNRTAQAAPPIHPAGNGNLRAIHVIDVHYLMLIAARLAPVEPLTSLKELGEYVDGLPWISYSEELPLTRRLWQTEIGRPFPGDLRLSVPDLRATLRAIVNGLGAGLVPDAMCANQIADGSVVELYPIRGLVPPDSMFANVRVSDLARPEIAAVLGRGDPGTDGLVPIDAPARAALSARATSPATIA